MCQWFQLSLFHSIKLFIHSVIYGNNVNYHIYFRRLLTQLETFKPGQKSSTPSKDSSKQSGDHVTYELFYRPEQAQFSRNAKVYSSLVLKIISDCGPSWLSGYGLT